MIGSDAVRVPEIARGARVSEATVFARKQEAIADATTALAVRPCRLRRPGRGA
ncbi:hypothetical protein [Streptomyces sp. NPDC101776]|uniref:hypothetical protein n=1 Tax=Streptomyces sp. NPDC101776 TaxID=3366146 RepID=UPI0038234307